MVSKIKLIRQHMGIKILNISIVEPLNEVERISLPRYKPMTVFGACLRSRWQLLS